MNTSLLKRLLLLAMLLGATFSSLAGLKSGDALPDLAKFNLEGKLPESWKGKVVLLDFWASWCAPCAKSFPVLDELQKKYGDRVAVIGVSVDEKKGKMDSFLQKHPVSFAIVRDAEQKLVAIVEPPTMPTSFVIDREGKVRFCHQGFHGDETRKEYLSEIDSLLK